ncbi:MAG TPA: tRNA (5-methylaminomethyl-2-thiouridine)(34)-methyltransferase MnmD [Puia sp.]
MSRKIIVTRDGSPSIEWQEGVTYHSTFGALQESRHIFIDRGWKALATRAHPPEEPMQNGHVSDLPVPGAPMRVFELGFGTGLNALLTLLEAETMRLPVYYEAVEAYPLEAAIFEKLDYCGQLARPGLQPKFLQLHTCDWDRPVAISPYFTFYKSRDKWPDHALRQTAELVYYDAFDAVVQPELWSAPAFKHLAGQLAPGALLLTYCSKGIVRRALQEAGFCVEKLPGPPGKREIVRAQAKV